MSAESLVVIGIAVDFTVLTLRQKDSAVNPPEGGLNNSLRFAAVRFPCSRHFYDGALGLFAAHDLFAGCTGVLPGSAASRAPGRAG